MLKIPKRRQSAARYKTHNIKRDITNISLGALGIKKYTSSIKRLFAFSWRFIFVFLLFFWLITGISPMDALLKSIYALNGQTETVKLYAGDCRVIEVSDDYKKGWWGADQAAREPELGPLADLLEFNDTNSAFYASGKGEVACASFSLLTTADLEEVDDVQLDILDDPIEEIEDTGESNNTESLEGSNETVEENEVSEQASEEEAGAEIIETEDNDSEVSVENGSEEDKSSLNEESLPGKIEIIETEKNSTEEPVEIITEEELAPEPVDNTDPVRQDHPSVPDPAKPAEEAQADEIDEDVLGYFKKGLNYLSSQIAKAEEYISTKITKLDELGEFRSATLNFSLALRATDGTFMDSESLDEQPAATEPLTDKTKDMPTNTTNTEDVVGKNNQTDKDPNTSDASSPDDPEASNVKENNTEASVVEFEEEQAEVSVEEAPVEEKTTEEVPEADEDVSLPTKEEETDLLGSLWKKFMPGSAAADIKTENGSAKLVIWYGIEEKTASGSPGSEQIATLWQELDVLTGENMSNALNDGYFSYEAPFIENWEDVNDLKIKVEGVADNETAFVAYLDSVWVEVEYDPETELEKLEKRQRWEEALDILSEQMTFKVNESGQMKFRYNKNEERIWDTLGEMMGLGNFWEDVDVDIWLENFKGHRINYPLTIIFEEDGEFSIKLPEIQRELEPGKYFIKFLIKDDSGSETEIFEFEQGFDWGVLAINTNKSVYLDGDEAYLQMAVLDNEGHTVCDADLQIELTTPSGGIVRLDTADGSITRNSLCGFNNVIDEPDYYANYTVNELGLYGMKLTASTTDGQKMIYDHFEATTSVPVEIERIGPTRIYPLADYTMSFLLTAHRDLQETGLVEYLPPDFVVTEQTVSIKTASSNDFILYSEHIAGNLGDAVFSQSDIGSAKELFWSGLLLAMGDVVRIDYVFDAPDRSPELFLLGPAQFASTTETRQWQIASDAIESIWSGINAGGAGMTVNSSTNADGSTTGNYADAYATAGDWSPNARTWTFDMSTSTISTSTINSVTLYFRHYASNFNDDSFSLQVYDGTAWSTVTTWSGGALPPSVGTTQNWDVSAVYDTWTKINTAQVRIIGAGKTGPADDPTWYVDTVELRVDYTNEPPTGSFLSAVQRIDTSGIVDVSMRVDDKENDDLSARIDYVAGDACDFTTPLDPTLDETDTTATSTYGDPKVDNNNTYQIGNSSGWIITTSGANDVHFDWTSISDLHDQEGIYCLRLTSYDGYDAQATSATTTLEIDNKAPSTPGSLSEWGTTTKDTIALSYGATSTDLNFKEYRIYYSTSTPVTESDYLLSSSTDINLADVDLNYAATTSVSGLLEDTTYYFSMWAYDDYGHISSSTPVAIKTNKRPLAVFDSVSEKTNGTGLVDISIKVGDKDNDLSYAKLEYEEGSSCAFLPSGDPTLDASSLYGSQGLPQIDNGAEFQIRNIMTSPATNTLSFDWSSMLDEPFASSTYCLRLTAYDGADSQAVSATTTVYIDNFDPATPGSLNEYSKSTTSVTLLFGTQSFDSNFKEYKIYYKAGASGVGESDTEFASSTVPGDPNLGLIDYGGVATTSIGELDTDTWYVFNIWAYDDYGNKASATEISIKTNSTVNNESLALLDPVASNYIITGGSEPREWVFRAVVSELNGWNILDEVVLRLANNEDTLTPYSDLAFKWSQTTDTFTEVGADAFGAVALTGNSSSTCALDTCTLDFSFTFNNDFSISGVDYDAELYTTNDSAGSAYNNYDAFYQVRRIYVEQIHYRWRNDDGGE